VKSPQVLLVVTLSEAIRYDIDKIINVANELQRTGSTAASAGETIVAAFVINCLEYLPEGCILEYLVFLLLC